MTSSLCSPTELRNPGKAGAIVPTALSLLSMLHIMTPCLPAVLDAGKDSEKPGDVQQDVVMLGFKYSSACPRSTKLVG